MIVSPDNEKLYYRNVDGSKYCIKIWLYLLNHLTCESSRKLCLYLWIIIFERNLNKFLKKMFIYYKVFGFIWGFWYQSNIFTNNFIHFIYLFFLPYLWTSILFNSINALWSVLRQKWSYLRRIREVGKNFLKDIRSGESVPFFKLFCL